MANINVVVEKPIADGYKLKFRTPCDSTTIEGLEVKYPAKNGVGTLIKKFVFKDAHGTELSGVGNLFVSGVMIEVLLDVTHGVAYIQNADTNSYVESVKGEIKRLEESQKQFLAVAGKAVERCENIADSADGFEQAMVDATERADSVKGVYVGSGDMPDGYDVQISFDGEVLEVDNELNAESKNPVSNGAVTKHLEVLETKCIELETRMGENYDSLAQNIGIAGNRITVVENSVSSFGKGYMELAASVEEQFNDQHNKFAPIGFGLGTEKPEKVITDPTELDNLKKTGWYAVDFTGVESGVTLCGITVQYATVHVVAIDGAGNQALCQTIYMLPSHSTSIVRRWYDVTNGFYEWECENPPLVDGVEYRTVERYDGKPVYMKRIVVTSLPNDSVSVHYYSSGQYASLVSFDGFIRGEKNSAGDGTHNPIGTISYWFNGEEQICSVYADGYGIRFTTQGDFSKYSAELVVKYIKVEVE